MSPPRVAVVTGGSSGIGLATGRHLARQGYQVVLNARSPERLRSAAEEIGARWVAADCSDPERFDEVLEVAGRVDLLVHAAGAMAGTFVRSETVDGFAALLHANLVSAFVVTNRSLPHMGAGGRIVFLSSSAAHSPQPGRSAYSASKAGLNAFARALGAEVERDGIAVHVVSTGPVATPMLEDVRFPMRTLAVEDVVQVIGWLDTLPHHAVVEEIVIGAVDGGPFAPAPFVPRAAEALGRTELPTR